MSETRFRLSLPQGDKPFLQKGLAFAHARRWAKEVEAGYTDVVRETREAGEEPWQAQARWRFFSDGDVREIV